MKRLGLLLLFPFCSAAQPIVIGNTHMLNPAGIAVGATKVYVANTAGVVTVFDMSGNFVEEIGTRGNGPGNLKYPYGVALDANGNIYVGDGVNLRVEVFAPDGTHTRSIDGEFASNGPGARLAVRIGPDDNLYVLDSDNRTVKVFTTTGELIRTIGEAGAGNGKFLFPGDVALDASGNVYVTDWYYFQGNVGRIQKFDNLGNYLSTTTADANFTGVAVSNAGRIYSIDTYGLFIRYYDQPSGAGTFGIQGQGGRQGEFGGSLGVDISSANEVYITDQVNNRVQVFNSSGVFVREFGSGLGVEGALKVPLVTDVDANGKIYIADSQNNRVQIFNADGTFNSSVGQFGFNDGEFAYAYNPRGVKADDAGNIYAMSGSRVQVFASNLTYTRSVGTGQISSATSGPYLHGTNIIVGDAGGLVKVFDNATDNLLLGFGPDVPDFESINYTRDVAADDDFYYVADGQRIVVFTHAGVFDHILDVGSVNALDVADGKIYAIIDESETLSVFDLGGTLLGGYGGYGTTPGKFVFPRKVTVKGNTLLVTDLTRVQKLDVTADFRAPQSIILETIEAKTFGDAPFDVIATATSGLAVVFSSSNPNVATVSGNTVTIISVGETTITASQDGGGTFFPVQSSRVLTVNKGTPTLIVDPIADKILSDAPFNITANSTSPSLITYESATPLVATVTVTGTVTLVGAGLATIQASQLENDNYFGASLFKSFNVDKIPQTITFNALPAATFGDDAFTLTATTTSGLPIVFTTSNSDIASVSGNTVTIHTAGAVLITASQAGNDAYAPAMVERVLTISKQDQAITFPALAEKTFGDAPITLEATASSGLETSYSVDDESIGTVAGAQLTIVGAGTLTITASQPGNSNYSAAIPVVRTLVVHKTTQTITFTTIADATLGDPPFTLTASASSGLGVFFSTTSDKISIAGNTVTMLQAGRVTVNAIQSGGPNHFSTSAEQSFCIRPAAPTITSSAGGETVTLTSSSATNYQWYLGEQPIPDSTSQTLTVTEAGQYFVRTTVDDCTNSSAGFPVIITGGIQPLAENELDVFPNPTAGDVMILFRSGVTAPISVKVVNAIGQHVHEVEGMANEPIAIDTRSWGTGVFVVRAVMGDVTLRKRVVRR